MRAPRDPKFHDELLELHDHLRAISGVQGLLHAASDDEGVARSATDALDNPVCEAHEIVDNWLLRWFPKEHLHP